MHVCLRLFVVLAFGGAATAQEVAVDNFSGVGVRAMGMGGAFVGVADDFSATYWNPAGLAQIEHREAYVGFLRSSAQGKTTLAGTTAASDLSSTRFSSLGVVFPYPVYQGSLVFALGITQTNEFDSSVPVRGPGQDFLLVNGTPAGLVQADNLFQHRGALRMTSVAGAIDVSPAVSLGISLNVWNGEDENRNEWQQTYGSDSPFGIRSAATSDIYDDDYDGFNAILGLFIRSPRKQPVTRFGFTVTSGVTHRVSYLFTGVPPPEVSIARYEPDQVLIHELGLPAETVEGLEYYQLPEGERIVEQGVDALGDPFVLTDANRTLVHRNIDDPATSQIETIVIEQFSPAQLRDSYELKLPLQFGVGISHEARPDLLIAASAHLAEWTQTEYKSNDLEQVRSSDVFQEEYRNALRYHLGIEWQVPVITLALRAGYYTDPVPYVGQVDEETNLNSIAINRDRRFFTAGAGMVFDRVIHLDVAIVRGSFRQTRGGEAQEQSFSRAFGSLAYRF